MKSAQLNVSTGNVFTSIAKNSRISHDDRSVGLLQMSCGLLQTLVPFHKVLIRLYIGMVIVEAERVVVLTMVLQAITDV